MCMLLYAAVYFYEALELLCRLLSAKNAMASIGQPPFVYDAGCPCHSYRYRMKLLTIVLAKNE